MMTTSDILNRGYNLMITAFLFLIGLGMAPDAVGEHEVLDRVDDLGLLIVGIVAVVWYLAGRSRFKRSLVLPALTLVALAIQIVGVVLEAGDKEAFGDNATGMVMLVALTVFALWHYVRRPAWIGAGTFDPESHGAGDPARS